MKILLTFLTLFSIQMTFILSCEQKDPISANNNPGYGQKTWDTLVAVCKADTLFVLLDSTILFGDSLVITNDSSKLDTVSVFAGYTINEETCHFDVENRNDTVLIKPLCNTQRTLEILSFTRSQCISIVIVQNGRVLTAIHRQGQGASRTLPIAIIFKNRADTNLCEAAPGDSIEMSCYFAAGKTIPFVQFSATKMIQTGNFQNDSVWDIASLEHIVIVPLRSKNDFTQHTAIRFKIPEDIIETSPAIDDKKLTQYGISKEFLFSSLNHLKDLTPTLWPSDSLVNELNKTGNGSALMQMLTVPYRVIVSFGDGDTVVSNLFVRPNRMFSVSPKKLDGVFVNRNPVLKSLSFSASGNAAFISDKKIDSIRVSRGEVCTLRVGMDSLLIDSTGTDAVGTVQTEQYVLDYIYSVDSNESHCVPMGPFGYLSGNSFSASFVSPDCEKIQLVHFWIILRDCELTRSGRPTGNTLYEADLKLIYE